MPQLRALTNLRTQCSRAEDPDNRSHNSRASPAAFLLPANDAGTTPRTSPRPHALFPQRSLAADRAYFGKVDDERRIADQFHFNHPKFVVASHETRNPKSVDLIQMSCTSIDLQLIYFTLLPPRAARVPESPVPLPPLRSPPRPLPPSARLPCSARSGSEPRPRTWRLPRGWPPSLAL